MYAFRLTQLREYMAQQQLDAFIVPRADAHQGEYVPACEERLAWLTGFGGSAGFAVILAREAALFVDGRYTIQAREQVDLSLYAIQSVELAHVRTWLTDHMKPGWRVGYDPHLHTRRQICALRIPIEAAGASCLAVEPNPIDIIWEDRPPPPITPIHLHPLDFAGETAASKIARVQTHKDLAQVDGMLISDPHAIAWLLNIRGGDVPHTPLVLSYAYVPRQGRSILFVALSKLSADVYLALTQDIEIMSEEGLKPYLQHLGETKAHMRFDQATASCALQDMFEQAGGTCVEGADPIELMKAVKTDAEQKGARAAHIRDGVAMVRFLFWLAHIAPGQETELSAAKALRRFREETGCLKDISFDTISAFGPHAALPHYHPTEETNVVLGDGVYLIDSGGQYEDGTTDITRTCYLGAPRSKAEMQEIRNAYTRVLKGHIAIANCIFPKGTSGAQLDAFARRALWEVGLDYDHGTGHGVGSYLSVHEGPQSLSKRGTTPLEPGMILSNEPGYYRQGHWGIRLEALCLVVRRDDIKGAEQEMFGFETLSLCPFDYMLVDFDLLSKSEKNWFEAYHKRVLEVLGGDLSEDERKWLEERWVPRLITPKVT